MTVKYRMFGTALLIAIMLSVGAARAPAADYLADAEALLAKGQLKAAELELKNAVRSDPKNLAAHYRLAVVQLELGNPVAAEHEARAARAGGYEPEQTVPLLAQTYLAQRKYQQLLQDFPAEEGSNAERAGVLVPRGYAQLALGKLDEAKQSFVEAQKLAPDAPGPLVAQAKVLTSEHQFATAEPLFDRALTLEPNSTDARLGKAHLLRLEGNLDGALSTLNELLTTNPNYLPARLERAEILVGKNDEQAAKADITAVLVAQPGNAGAIYLDAVVAAKDKDFQKANADLQKISGVLPYLPRGYYVQSVVQYNLGQFEQAEDSARRYVARSPDDLAGHKLLAAVALQLKHPADAVDALAKFESEGKADAAALDLLGRAYIQIGKTAEALSALSAAVKLEPENAALHTRLAGVQLSTGHREQGVADLEQSLDIAPTAPAAEMLVLTELRAGHFDQAREAADKLQKAQPDSPVPGNLVGLIALSRFDLEIARAQFTQVTDKFPDFTAAQLNLARALELEGRSEDAEEVLQRTLKTRPADTATLARLVELLLRRGQGDAAIAATERAHTVMPNNQQITLGLIDLYIRQNQADKALTLARQQGVTNEASNIPLILARARAEFAAGRKAEAIETYRQLVELAPSNVALRRQLADLLLSNGDTAGAQQLIDQGLQLQPQNTVLAAERIAIALKASGVEEAVATAHRLRDTNPDLPTAAALEGDAYMMAGQYAKAAEAYAASLSKSPSTMLAIAVARAKSAAGDADGATAVLREWSTAHPNDKAVLMLLSNYDLTAHRFEAAKQELESVGDALAQEPVALNNLAWLYQKLGDPRARSEAERAYLAAPNLPQTKDTLGWILVKEGQAAAAIGLLQEASAAGLQNPEIQYHLAVALNMVGRQPEALKILTDLLGGKNNFDEKPEAEKLFAELSKH
ncbi:MAG: PEP-CTERM system TPR-repeat protein PrsT [Deltaproteobacteria bacterium]|nr:PEP-CTERM system TPR-repeat protein PrsT [Deltaproteobacteria bacterium]